VTPHDTPREARKKLLLLEGQLHRLDLIEARQAWRTVGREGRLGAPLPASLGAALKSGGGRLLLTALPLLLRSGTLGRWSRRAALLAGGGAAAWAMLNRWLRRDESGTETVDEKNPGRNRD
jgi:hypothetical protein